MNVKAKGGRGCLVVILAVIGLARIRQTTKLQEVDRVLSKGLGYPPTKNETTLSLAREVVGRINELEHVANELYHVDTILREVLGIPKSEGTATQVALQAAKQIKELEERWEDSMGQAAWNNQ